MNTDNFLHGILNDLAVELTDDFDRSFERKSFFGTPWAPAKSSSPLGSLMLRSGSLRQSIRHSISGHAITWQSSLPYASIMNEGGTIVVTVQICRDLLSNYCFAPKQPRISRAINFLESRAQGGF